MQTSSFLATTLLATSLLLAPRPGAAQSGGQPVHPTRTTQYVMHSGAVMQRLGGQLTALDQNLRLPNGTKINVKSGIIELPGGKITTLREGDYVNAEGGIVFGTPGSAAAARGDNSVSADAKFTPYVQVGTAPTTVLNTSSTDREQLLTQKVELLTRKVTLLQQTHPNAPNTDAVDKQLLEIDAKLKTLK